MHPIWCCSWRVLNISQLNTLFRGISPPILVASRSLAYRQLCTDTLFRMVSFARGFDVVSVCPRPFSGDPNNLYALSLPFRVRSARFFVLPTRTCNALLTTPYAWRLDQPFSRTTTNSAQNLCCYAYPCILPSSLACAAPFHGLLSWTHELALTSGIPNLMHNPYATHATSPSLPPSCSA